MPAVAVPSDFSPIGFSGAVLPLLSALDDRAALQRQRERMQDERNQECNAEPVAHAFGRGHGRRCPVVFADAPHHEPHRRP